MCFSLKAIMVIHSPSLQLFYVMISNDCVSCGAHILNMAYPYVARPKNNQVASKITGDILCSSKLIALVLSTSCVIDVPLILDV